MLQEFRTYPSSESCQTHFAWPSSFASGQIRGRSRSRGMCRPCRRPGRRRSPRGSLRRHFPLPLLLQRCRSGQARNRARGGLSRSWNWLPARQLLRCAVPGPGPCQQRISWWLGFGAAYRIVSDLLHQAVPFLRAACFLALLLFRPFRCSNLLRHRQLQSPPTLTHHSHRLRNNRQRRRTQARTDRRNRSNRPVPRPARLALLLLGAQEHLDGGAQRLVRLAVAGRQRRVLAHGARAGQRRLARLADGLLAAGQAERVDGQLAADGAAEFGGDVVLW